jgi:hypothetical protein
MHHSDVLFFIMESSDTLRLLNSCNILHAHYHAVLSAAHKANEIQLLYSIRQRSWPSASLHLHPEISFLSSPKTVDSFS